MQFYGRRVAGWCAVLVMAVALVAILAGCQGAGTPLEAVAPSPSPGTPSEATYPRVLSYSDWRAQTPILIATEDEVRVALIEAGIPHQDAAHLARVAVSCEAPARQRDGVSIGARMDARGDEGGRSQGPLQLNTVAHEWARGMYLADLTASAEAAARVYRMQGVNAWTCSDGGR